MKRGEVTAYLSLIFILLVTFVCSMIESASLQNAKNYRRADVNRAVECIFAEYQKELLEEYDIFALEAGYETGEYDENNLYDRLAYYGAGNMEQKLLRIQFLTDNGYQSFYEQAAAYMKHKYGIDRVEEYMAKTDEWREQEEKAEGHRQEEIEKQERFSELLEENEGELPTKDNPIDYVNSLKKLSILSLVMPKDKAVSGKQLPLSDTVSHRVLNRGYGDFTDVSEPPGTAGALLFNEYIMEHFTAADDAGGTGAVDYEIEYILEGGASDKENLESVVNKLLLFRTASNYIYLQSDGERKAEAETLALTLCALLAVPAVTEAAAQIILAAWAYGESIMDMRSLLRGGRVPLVKTKESWQLQLSSLMKLGTENDQSEGMDAEGGLKYKEYLRMLLFLEERRNVRGRALDMIEQNLRTMHGQKYFHADQCVSRMGLSSICTFRRGISYQFSTYFGYN